MVIKGNGAVNTMEAVKINTKEKGTEQTMGKIFYMMGKSSSGKDTIFEKIIQKKELELHQIVLYTTRPARANETDGVQYHFVDEARLLELQKAGKVIELRAYQVVGGVWKYFTVDDEQTDLKNKNYLAIGTLVSYEKLRDYYGEEKLVAIYIEVENGERLARALERERRQNQPNYDELCRRFLADNADFSEENLTRAGIKKRFQNKELQKCVEEIAVFISENSR